MNGGQRLQAAEFKIELLILYKCLIDKPYISKMKAIFVLTSFLLIGLIQPSKVVFDIPLLKGKSIVEIRKLLGKPTIDDVPLNYKTESGVNGDAYFSKDGFVLEVTYNPVNNKVNDFFLGKEKSVTDYKILEEAGNLLKSNDFILSPVKSTKNPQMFTGVTITPK